MTEKAKGGRGNVKLSEQRKREGGSPARGEISHRPVSEPIVVGGRDVDVDPPDDLDGDAAELWRDLLPSLRASNLADRVDRPALRNLCVLFGRSRTAGRLLDSVDPDADAELRKTLEEARALFNAAKVQAANKLRAGVEVKAAELNAINSGLVTIANLGAYLEARKVAGGMVALGSTGQLVESPLVSTERNSAALFLRYATEYGLTALARTKLGLNIIQGRSLQAELEEKLGGSGR